MQLIGKRGFQGLVVFLQDPQTGLSTPGSGFFQPPSDAEQVVDMLDAIEQFDIDMLPTADLATEFVLPIEGMIDPAEGFVFVFACLRKWESGLPAVIYQVDELDAAPFALAAIAVEKVAIDDVVAIAKEVDLHDKWIADRALDHEAAPIDLGAHIFQDDPALRHISII